MSSETTYKIILYGSDGKQYHIDLSDPSNVGWLQQKLGICELESKIQASETRILALEQGSRLKNVVELLEDQPSGRIWRYLERRIPNLSMNDRRVLLEQKIVIHFTVGNCHKYRLSKYGEIKK
jgi:hypothetical protein